MKAASLIASAVLATAAVLPHTAEAGSGDKALAAVGGFIGGVIVGTHLERDHHRGPPVIVDDCPPPGVVVRHHHRPHHRDGYWSERTVRVWVPGRMIRTRDHYGRRVTIEEPGRYEYRRERVWVEDHRRGYGRHW